MSSRLGEVTRLAGNGDALLHAAGQLVRVVALEGAETHEVHQALGVTPGLVAVDLQRQPYVGVDGAPG